MNYSKSTQLLQQLVDDCFQKPSNVYFLYFTANNKSPRVKCFLGTWNVENQTYYVTHGIDKNYVYVYNKQGITAAVNIISNGPEPFNAAASDVFHLDYPAKVISSHALRNSQSTEVEIGNHITFSIHEHNLNGKGVVF